MRFLHTADWHIGKKLHDYSLVEEQKDAFEQIKQIAKEKAVDAVVVAGDLYDRSLPSETSVALVNEMLQELNLQAKLSLLVISGNHDSATRLATGSDWFKQTDFYLHTSLAEAFEPVEFADTQFFLLPYFEMQAARNYFETETLTNLNEAMKLIVAELEKKFDPAKKHVLVAHFFAVGSLKTDSETKLEIGGLDAVSPELFEKFDYVALGHLHDRNALKAERVRYSGSLLKYSISEAKRPKGVWLIDTDPFTCEWIELTPLNDVKVLCDSYENLTTEGYQKVGQHDYISIELTDEQPILDVVGKLRQYFPQLLDVRRKHKKNHAKKIIQVEQKTPLELFDDFFLQVTGKEPTKLQQKWARESLLEITKAGEPNETTQD